MRKNKQHKSQRAQRRGRGKKEWHGMKQCGSLFWEFFKIGLFTIGGGTAMIPQIQQIAVKDKGWLTDEEMIDCIAISQSLPGVIAINSATYIGKKKKGIAGALAATLGVAAPSFVIIILAATALGAMGDNRYLTGAFIGIKAAVCGLILVTVVKLGKQMLKSAFQWALAVASFAAVGIFGITAVWGILAGAVLGILWQNNMKGIVRGEKDENESGAAFQKKDKQEDEE